jgi:hypothetical protein
MSESKQVGIVPLPRVGGALTLAAASICDLHSYCQTVVWSVGGVNLQNAWLSDVVADVIAAMHIAYFVYVAGGSAAIVVGAIRRWKWVRNPWFRFSHLAAVYIVVFENIFNIQCPLNMAEWSLRSDSQAVVEASSGVGGLLDRLLFHTIPGNVLNVMYSVLAVFLLVALVLVPPRLTLSSKSGG